MRAPDLLFNCWRFLCCWSGVTDVTEQLLDTVEAPPDAAVVVVVVVPAAAAPVAQHDPITKD